MRSAARGLVEIRIGILDLLNPARDQGQMLSAPRLTPHLHQQLLMDSSGWLDVQRF